MGTDENAGGRPATDSHPIKEGVEILSLSYRTDRDKLRADGPLASMHTLPTSTTDLSENYLDMFIVENVPRRRVRWNPKIDVIYLKEFYGYKSLPVDILAQFKALKHFQSTLVGCLYLVASIRFPAVITLFSRFCFKSFHM